MGGRPAAPGAVCANAALHDATIEVAAAELDLACAAYLSEQLGVDRIVRRDRFVADFARFDLEQYGGEGCASPRRGLAGDEVGDRLVDAVVLGTVCEGVLLACGRGEGRRVEAERYLAAGNEHEVGAGCAACEPEARDPVLATEIAMRVQPGQDEAMRQRMGDGAAGIDSFRRVHLRPFAAAKVSECHKDTGASLHSTDEQYTRSGGGPSV